MAEKQDFVYVVLAIAVVLLIALVIKPAMTGDAPGFRWRFVQRIAVCVAFSGEAASPGLTNRASVPGFQY